MAFLVDTNNLSDVASAPTSVQNLGATHAVGKISDLQGMTATPQAVVVKSGVSIGDGAGGVFAYDSTDTSTPDDGAMVIINASHARYKRIYSGRVQAAWFGLSTSGDNGGSNGAIQKALNVGKDVDIPANTSWQVTTLTLNFAQALYLNGATLVGINTGTGADIVLLAAVGAAFHGGGGTLDCRGIGISGFDVSSAVSLTRDYTQARDFTVIGQPYNPQLPSHSTGINPFLCVNVGREDYGPTQNPGIRLTGTVVDNVRLWYGHGGMRTNGEDYAQFTNIWAYNSVTTGVEIGALYAPYENTVYNIHCQGHGYYGFDWSNFSHTQQRAMPVSDMDMWGIVLKHNAWMGMYADLSQGVGSSKLGADITSNNAQRFKFDIMAYNNNAGGVEIKRTLTYAGGGSDPGVQPSTPAYGFYQGHVNSYFAMDWIGHGVIACVGAPNSYSTDYSGAVIEANSWYVGCPPWQAAQAADLWSPVMAFGWNYLCIGDGTGKQGPMTGPLCPGVPVNTVATTSTSSTAVGGTTVNVTSAAGVAVGQLVVCSAAQIGVATLVTHVSGTTITVNPSWGAAIGSGMSISFQGSTMVQTTLAADVTVVVLNTNASTASGHVLPFALTTGVVTGQTVAGTHIPASTYVQSFTMTSVTLTNPVIGTVANGAAITFGPNTCQVASAAGITVGQTAMVSYAALSANSTVVAITGTTIVLSNNFNISVDGTTPISFATPGTIGAALTTSSGPTALGANSVVVTSATGIAAGCVVFLGTALPDGTKVANTYTPGNTTVPLTASFTAALPSNSTIYFASEFFDGLLWWRALQPTPTSVYALNINNAWITGIDGLTLTGSSWNTTRFLLDSAPSTTVADAKTTRTVVRNARAVGTSTAFILEGSSGGQVDLDLVGCHIQNDSTNNTSQVALMVQNAITANIRIYGGRIWGGWSSSQGIRALNGQGSTINLEVDGGAYIGANSWPIYLEDGNTYNVKLRNCVLESPTGAPVTVAGSGTLQFGDSCQLIGNANYPGWQRTAGTTTVSGQPRRLDLGSFVPTSGTVGNVGEFFHLDTPTVHVRGYICTAASGGTYTWKEIPVGIGVDQTGGGTTFLANTVDLNVTAAWLDGPNTGSIGAVGQTWQITAKGVAYDDSSGASIWFRVVDGSSNVYDTNAFTCPSANYLVSASLGFVVTLTGATTFKLQASDRTSTHGHLLSSADGTTVKATSITAVRIA